MKIDMPLNKEIKIFMIYADPIIIFGSGKFFQDCGNKLDVENQPPYDLLFFSWLYVKTHKNCLLQL